MKKITLTLLVLITALTPSYAQTTLSPGDIMFLGISADETTTNQIGSEGSADEFLFVLLEPVTSGTEIYFTDMGYVQNSTPYFQTNENNGCAALNGAASDAIIKWTATSNLTAGTQVLIRTKITPNVTNIGSVSVIVDRVSGGGSGMSLTSSGETIHAFQGTINGSNQVATATLLASLRVDDTWAGLTQCQFTSTLSNDPGTGFEVEWNTSSPNDNGVYTGTLTGDKASLQKEILKASNWDFTNSNTEVPTMPISGGFTLTTNNAEFKLHELKLLPNPVKDILEVKTTAEIKDISVLNLLGKTVLKSNLKQIDFSGLSNGVYVLKLNTSKGLFTRRIIKR